MSGFQAPPQADFRSCSQLMSAQAGHLGQLGKWSGAQCANAGGLEGLLYPLTAVVPRVADLFTGKLAQCQRGLGDVSAKVQLTGEDYAGAEHANISAIARIYPDSLPHFPDIGALHLPNVGNFTDEPVRLKEPESAEADTAENIKHQLQVIRGKFGVMGSALGTAEKVFKFFTGQDLVGLLLDPLLGEYGRLRYLHDAYTELADGAYTVAATMRKGSWALADEWTGQAATNFDSYMFRWSMGIGGLGDAATVIAKAYRDGYYAVVALVQVALRAINKLMTDELEQLAKQGAELFGGDAAIEAVGLGPEDPVADGIAAIWTAYRLYQIYRIVSAIITVINSIEETFRLISKAIDDIRTAVDDVVKFFESPVTLPSVSSLVNDVEQRGFSFEQDHGWNADLGAARIAFLPPA